MASGNWELAYRRALGMANTQGGFLGRSSHELRAPFNHIISLHQLVLEGLCEDPEEERLFLRQSMDAVQVVLKNLDQLIAVSKLVVGTTEPVLLPLSLGDMVTSAEALMEMVIKNRNCRLKQQPPADEVLVESDYDWLRQVLVLVIEAAIATQAAALTFQWNATDNQTARLTISTDTSPASWQAQEPKATLEEPPEPPQLPQLSPRFKVELAQHIVQALGGSLKGLPGEDPGADHFPEYQVFEIYLPLDQG